MESYQYDDGYYTQTSYPQMYRRVMVVDSDGHTGIMSADVNDRASTVLQPVRVVYSTRQQPTAIDQRPTTQVYRVGPRFNASVSRVDRRGSVDSALATRVIRSSGAATRDRRFRPVLYDDQQRTTFQAAGPQVVHVGSGRLRLVDPAQPVYRVVSTGADTSPWLTTRNLQYRATGSTQPSLYQSETTQQRTSTEPTSQSRLVSRLHPVRSETELGRTAGIVYSSECHAPVSHYVGGPYTSNNSQQHSTGVLWRGNSGETSGYGTLPGADGRQAVRVKLGEITDHRQSYSEDTNDTLQHQVYQTQPPAAQHDTTYYHGRQPSTTSNVTCTDEAGMSPSFSVRAVGPVTDFGELVCESIRQFMLHRQRQQQQQQQQKQQQQQILLPRQQSQQEQSATPWRRTRQKAQNSVPQPDTIITPTTIPQRQPTTSIPDHVSTISTVTTPCNTTTPDDRNMFQRYNFQFASIGSFGRDDATPAATTGTGSSNRQVRERGSGLAPVAVFRFHDFDDMVARMREQSATSTSVVNVLVPANSSCQPVSDVHQQQQQQQSEPYSQRLHNIAADDEADVDSGYSTSQSMAESRNEWTRDDMVPTVRHTNDALVLSTQVVNSREELRRKITSFNNNTQGCIMSLEQNSDVFHGFIRVIMNLIRPVHMSLTSQQSASGTCDVTDGSRDQSEEVTTFHLPKDTAKVIHITSETTTREVIQMLLGKFHIQDNPRKFALYEQLQDGHGRGDSMRRLSDRELPLPLCLHWAEDGTNTLNTARLILQENDTGEIMWEAFSLPELESFLLILHKEEEAYQQEIRQTYHVLKVQMKKRLRQLRKDRIAHGAKLKPAASR